MGLLVSFKMSNKHLQTLQVELKLKLRKKMLEFYGILKFKIINCFYIVYSIKYNSTMSSRRLWTEEVYLS